METIRLLTFSTLYPNNMRPNHGIFVEHRLRHLLASGETHSKDVPRSRGSRADRPDLVTGRTTLAWHQSSCAMASRCIIRAIL
jgi:hypothetical protein